MTVINWVEFLLGVSVLSLFVSNLFERQVIGSNRAAAMRKIAGDQGRRESFLTVKLYCGGPLGMGLLLPPLAARKSTGR